MVGAADKYTLDLAAQQMIAQHPVTGYFPAGPSFLICAACAAARSPPRRS